MSSDRFNVNTSLSKNWEHLENKFVGTGHPDTTRHQWATNHHRDTYASILGHYDLLSYVSIAENISVGRMKFQLQEKMIQPVGLPPKTNTSIIVTGNSSTTGSTSGITNTLSTDNTTNIQMKNTTK